nr:vanadium-dependent haloperoxidase [Bacteroidota bacterium]
MLLQIQPHWGDVRPFVAQNPNIWMPNPLTYSLSPQSNYYKQALEVYNTKINLTAAQSTIAQYWADGGGTITPPGHSMNIATQVIRKEGNDLYKTAEVYSRVGMALADGFIQCWKEKYVHNAMRPITYINYYIDPAWTPLIATPPFPEYSSGHSSQSGAASQVLSSNLWFQTIHSPIIQKCLMDLRHVHSIAFMPLQMRLLCRACMAVFTSVLQTKTVLFAEEKLEATL